MGFIAQDVQTVLRDLGYDDQGFLTKDDQGKMSLRYNDLIAVLTKAIQEQQQIIDLQKNQLEHQNKDLSELKSWKEKVNQVLGLIDE